MPYRYEQNRGIFRKIKAKVYINLQGDEPIIDSANIIKMIKTGVQEPDLIINGWASIQTNKEYISRIIPKVVIKEKGDLMYMSRSPVPGNKLNKFVEAKNKSVFTAFL
jgi:3-deoxy-manno-octulosonate cytidylyltransferase (CMP-KDO synthetase)